MKALIALTFCLLMTTIAVAETAGTVYQCADNFYELAGASNKKIAMEQCQKRHDLRFVQCVVSSYNNLAFNHTFESAIANCNVQIPLLTREAKECLGILKSAQFAPARALELCEWVRPSKTLSIPKCVLKNLKKSGNRQTNEELVISCYEQFERFELNKEGDNVEEIERQRKVEAARLAQEVELQAQKAEQRRAAEIAAREKEQASQSTKDKSTAPDKPNNEEESGEQPPLPDQEPVPQNDGPLVDLPNF